MSTELVGNVSVEIWYQKSNVIRLCYSGVLFGGLMSLVALSLEPCWSTVFVSQTDVLINCFRHDPKLHGVL